MKITRKKDAARVRIVGHNKKMFGGIIALTILLIIVVCLIRCSESREKIIGGDKDEHGCLIAAGYSWNETRQKCVREWEEQNKVYCADGQRNADVCASLWQPVCANAYEIGDKTAKTYSSSCVACRNSDVEYYIEDECKESKK